MLNQQLINHTFYVVTFLLTFCGFLLLALLVEVKKTCHLKFESFRVLLTELQQHLGLRDAEREPVETVEVSAEEELCDWFKLTSEAAELLTRNNTLLIVDEADVIDLLTDAELVEKVPEPDRSRLRQLRLQLVDLLDHTQQGGNQ